MNAASAGHLDSKAIAALVESCKAPGFKLERAMLVGGELAEHLDFDVQPVLALTTLPQPRHHSAHDQHRQARSTFVPASLTPAEEILDLERCHPVDGPGAENVAVVLRQEPDCCRPTLARLLGVGCQHPSPPALYLRRHQLVGHKSDQIAASTGSQPEPAGEIGGRGGPVGGEVSAEQLAQRRVPCNIAPDAAPL